MPGMTMQSLIDAEAAEACGRKYSTSITQATNCHPKSRVVVDMLDPKAWFTPPTDSWLANGFQQGCRFLLSTWRHDWAS